MQLLEEFLRMERTKRAREEHTIAPAELSKYLNLQSLFALLDVKMEKIMNPCVYDASSTARHLK